MKGLSQTLYLVVVAVVILIVALVLLTIFGSGVGVITGLTQNTNLCITKATSSCTATGQMPVDWRSSVLKDKDNKPTSCYNIIAPDVCTGNSFEFESSTEQTT
ncbi:MAG: hypothetical protein KKB03_04125 [Nanoarchaeota archaeon]|nr:hypothetical protein [Nanoarchaeota archaeon]MBU1135803.1 hypothetical protein [Nanoarchaeota archaeon]MBU2520401.1 hypothetical protein [Nanoarchaeota archaeon]